MIAIRNAVTGEIEFVGSLDGYGEDWAQVGPALPDDVPLAEIALVDGAWVRDLDPRRQRAWAAVKAARDRAEWGGCDTPLGRVDTDPDSQRKISGAVQMAMIAQAAGEPFALDWTMRDNAVVAHDAGAMIALGVAVGFHVAACHAVATAKRVKIGDAASVEQIEAVDVEGGWPA